MEKIKQWIVMEEMGETRTTFAGPSAEGTKTAGSCARTRRTKGKLREAQFGPGTKNSKPSS